MNPLLFCHRVRAWSCGSASALLLVTESGCSWALHPMHITSPGLTEWPPWIHTQCCWLWLHSDLCDLSTQGQLEAHQEEGMVISHMAMAGVGLWIAFTTGSTLRLFHTETLKHLQDVNIAAPVQGMLPGTG